MPVKQRPNLPPLANQYGSAACQFRLHILLLVSRPGCEPQLLAQPFQTTAQAKTTVAGHGHGGGGHCQTNVAAGNLRTSLMRGEAAHTRPKAPGQEAEGAWGACKCAKWDG